MKFPRRGFTMIEVLVAMILLATVGVGLLLALLNMGRMTQGSNQQNFMARLTDQKLKSLGEFVSAHRMNTAGSPMTLGTHAPETVEGMKVGWQVTAVGSPEKYRDVTITVTT